MSNLGYEETNLEIENSHYVVIQAFRTMGDHHEITFSPIIEFYLDADVDNPRIITMALDKKYPTARLLAFEVSQWANMMFNRVDSIVAVVDLDGCIEEHLDVEDVFEVELAADEYEKVKRTDNFMVH